MTDLPLERLLWPPMPDPLPPPASRRSRRLRHLLASIATRVATARLSVQDLVERRVRRGAVQALVREAYLASLAEQDDVHRRPDAFAQAWKAHLAALIEHPSDEVSGWWGGHAITAGDIELAWALYEAASHARQQAIARARATPSKRTVLGSRQTPIFEFTITGGDAELGYIKYGICPACRVGLLYKIEFAPDWQFCGLGRLALGQLETRHPELTWYTTGQFKDARGFYERYRQTSDSPGPPSTSPARISSRDRPGGDCGRVRGSIALAGGG